MSLPIAILLCAGYGTRMGALTAETPKPLLPVAGKPVLDYLLEELLELDGLGALHLVSNSRYAGAFRAWAESWHQRRGVDLTVHDDGSSANDDRLGAIGDLGFVLRRTAAPAGALVAAGDNIYLFSLRPLWRAFAGRQGSWVLGLEENDPKKLRRTGVLELGPGDRVEKLHEKPDDPPSDRACPSLYCLRPEALARVEEYLAVPSHNADEIGRFAAYLATREPLYACRTSGRRLHVGSPESLRQADEILRKEMRHRM